MRVKRWRLKKREQHQEKANKIFLSGQVNRTSEKRKSFSRWWWSGFWGTIVVLPVVLRIVQVKIRFLRRWLRKIVVRSESKKKKIVWRKVRVSKIKVDPSDGFLASRTQLRINLWKKVFPYHRHWSSSSWLLIDDDLQNDLKIDSLH